MKLDADGTKRLDTMKRTLAAGLPLAGLLVGTVHVASAVVPGQMLGAPLPLDMRRGEPLLEKPVEKLAEPSASVEGDTSGTDDSHRWSLGDIPGPDEPPPTPPSALP